METLKRSRAVPTHALFETPSTRTELNPKIQTKLKPKPPRPAKCKPRSALITCKGLRFQKKRNKKSEIRCKSRKDDRISRTLRVRGNEIERERRDYRKRKKKVPIWGWKFRSLRFRGCLFFVGRLLLADGGSHLEVVVLLALRWFGHGLRLKQFSTGKENDDLKEDSRLGELRTDMGSMIRRTRSLQMR